jgi:hypothetical protein
MEVLPPKDPMENISNNVANFEANLDENLNNSDFDEQYLNGALSLRKDESKD